MEIIVVDDGSTDATPQCAMDARTQDGRIRLLRSRPGPAGWAGKTWAMAQGVREAKGEWMVFCDADTVLAPRALCMAEAMVKHENLDCLSLAPQMMATRLPVAALLACFAVTRAIFFRPARPGQPGLIQGAFLVVRRAAYDTIGGVEGFKGSPLEDVEMGRALQEAGLRVRMQPPTPLARTSMYPSFQEAWEGLSKHVYPVMSYSTNRMGLAIGACIGMILFPAASLIVAAAMLIHAPGTEVACALAASLTSVTLMYAFVTRVLMRESLPFFTCLILPVSLFLFGAVALNSMWAYTQGQVMWKGRRYSVPGAN
jgi:cellulose synthase/poly-beta-1,6-N-acetylglucosamine synthase-like glycosyltransferase